MYSESVSINLSVRAEFYELGFISSQMNVITQTSHIDFS